MKFSHSGILIKLRTRNTVASTSCYRLIQTTGLSLKYGSKLDTTKFQMVRSLLVKAHSL